MTLQVKFKPDVEEGELRMDEVETAAQNETSNIWKTDKTHGDASWRIVEGQSSIDDNILVGLETLFRVNRLFID